MLVKRTLVKRNPALVRPPRNDPRQGRRDPDYIRQLATDMQRHGLRNPPYAIHSGAYDEIVVGEHRRLAGVQLGWTEMDFYLIDGELSEVDLVLERWREADMHQGFSPLEKANAIQILLQSGLSRGQVAELRECSEADISRLMRIKGDLHPSLMCDVDSGKLGVSLAYLLATVSHEQQLPLAEKIYAGLMTKDALAAKIKGLRGNGKAEAKPLRAETRKGLVLTIPGLSLEALLGELLTVVQAVKKMQTHGLPPASLPSLLRGS